MSSTEIGQFSWHVESTFKAEDGTFTTRPEPVIWMDGSIRNPDGSAYRHLEDAEALPGELQARTLVITEMALINGPQGETLGMVPLQTIRLPFAESPTGGLPMWERLALSMRGEVPTQQVAVAPASALAGLQGHLGPGGTPRR